MCDVTVKQIASLFDLLFYKKTRSRIKDAY